MEAMIVGFQAIFGDPFSIALLFFGVFMGIPLFGFWGIIFGPLLISIFLLLIKIYYHEFKLMTPQEIKEERMDELSAKSGQGRKGLRFGKRRK